MKVIFDMVIFRSYIYIPGLKVPKTLIGTILFGVAMMIVCYIQYNIGEEERYPRKKRKNDKNRKN